MNQEVAGEAMTFHHNITWPDDESAGMSSCSRAHNGTTSKHVTILDISRRNKDGMGGSTWLRAHSVCFKYCRVEERLYTY